MSSPASHPPLSSAPPGISERLTQILGALGRAAAAHAAKNWAAAPIVILLWSYLNRVAARFHTLAARPRARHVVVRSRRPPAARTPASRLPRGFAWLRQLVPEARSLGSQLQHLLVDPDMAAFLETEPRAGRILRPLCRMLGLSPGPDLPAALFRPPAAPSPHRTAGSPPPPPPEPSARLEDCLAHPAVRAEPA